MLKFFKKFFLIFSSKLDRTLDELDSIQNRCHRVKKGYNEALVVLTNNRVNAEANQILYQQHVDLAKSEIKTLENLMLRAHEAGEKDDVDQLNNELESLEANLAINQEALDSFNAQIAELDEADKDLRAEIRQAEHTLSLAETRYKVAKDLLATNQAMPESLRNQLEDIRKEADTMAARYKGAKQVQARSQPNTSKIKAKYATPTRTAEDRIKALQAKQTG